MIPSSVLNDLPVLPLAESFALTEAYNLDTFPEKVNLGQGVYRDEECQPWILPSVRSVRITNKFFWAPSHSIITGRGVPAQATSQPRISSNTGSR
jgi:aspartate/tyrosine/aromatic aminotransferase